MPITDPCITCELARGDAQSARDRLIDLVVPNTGVRRVLDDALGHLAIAESHLAWLRYIAARVELDESDTESLRRKLARMDAR